jgi:hypothetical protein
MPRDTTQTAIDNRGNYLKYPAALTIDFADKTPQRATPASDNPRVQIEEVTRSFG